MEFLKKYLGEYRTENYKLETMRISAVDFKSQLTVPNFITTQQGPRMVKKLFSFCFERLK